MVFLGSYQFGCAYNSAMPVQLAPPKEVTVEVFGNHGVGKILGGRSSRLIPIRATYRGYVSGIALYARINADDNEKTATVTRTLSVDGITATNCILKGVNVDENTVFRDGKNGLFCALDVVLLFEQLYA